MMNEIHRYLLTGLLVALLSACQKPPEQTNDDFQVPVRVAQAGVAVMERQIVTGGSLRAPQMATLTVETPGVIKMGDGKHGPFEEGDEVVVGTILGTVSGEGLKLSIERDVVKQRLDTARINLEISEKAIANQLTSIKEHNYLKDAYEEARLEYQKSLNTEAQSQIRSPISGVILRYFRDENGQRMANGQRVEAGEEVARVAPLLTLIADIQLVSSDIAQVRKGIRAKIISHVWQDKVFTGEVLRLAPTVDDATRTLQAQVRIDNQEGLLKPGMLVEVALVLERKEQAITVPVSSIAERGGRQVVFVQNGLRAEQRSVQLGIRQGDLVEVIDGVAVGESIVVMGHDTLADQMPILVVTAPAVLKADKRSYAQ